MTRPVVALLNPSETCRGLLERREAYEGAGFSLEVIVDPQQTEEVTQSDGIVVTNSVPLAVQLCGSALLQYGDIIIHSTALEVSPWKRRVI